MKKINLSSEKGPTCSFQQERSDMRENTKTSKNAALYFTIYIEVAYSYLSVIKTFLYELNIISFKNPLPSI